MIRAWLWLIAAAIAAAQPRFENATVVQHDGAAESIETVLERVRTGVASPAWIGFSMPARVLRDRCCTGGNSYLEPTGPAHVMLRIEKGEVQRIRIETWECAIDLGGLTLHWINGARPEDTTRVLTRIARQSSEKRVRSSAVMALGMSREPGAMEFLAGVLSK